MYLVKVQGPTRCTADHRTHENRASEPLDRGPYFDVSVSRNVTALVGKTATLNCRVRNLGDKTVSKETVSLSRYCKIIYFCKRHNATINISSIISMPSTQREKMVTFIIIYKWSKFKPIGIILSNKRKNSIFDESGFWTII